MKTQARILVIDDNLEVQRFIADFLEKACLKSDSIQIELCSATTIEEAKKCFKKHDGNFDLIAIDACLQDSSPDTVPLIEWIREKSYKREMVGISGSGKFNKLLVAAGCDKAFLKYTFPMEILACLEQSNHTE